jgi:hypothetical protein
MRVNSIGFQGLKVLQAEGENKKSVHYLASETDMRLSKSEAGKSFPIVNLDLVKDDSEVIRKLLNELPPEERIGARCCGKDVESLFAGKLQVLG